MSKPKRPSTKLIGFLRKLASLMEKYDARLEYTIDDDGIHASVAYIENKKEYRDEFVFWTKEDIQAELERLFP